MLKLALVTSILPLISVSLLSISQSASAKLAYSGDRNLSAIVARSFSTVRKHADVVTPELANDRFLKMLVAASKRSIHIRVITNKTKNNSKLAAVLEKHRIDVRYAPLTLHYGFAIVDGPRAGDTSGKRARVISSNTGLAVSKPKRRSQEYQCYPERVPIGAKLPRRIQLYLDPIKGSWQQS